MSIKELESTVHELQELRRIKEELKSEITGLEDAIKSEMGDREQITAGAYRIDWKAVVTTRIDTTALKKALPKIADRFMKQTTTRCFCVR
ncbi:MAG: hypothetical protein J6K32_04530 [Clostridia bacterium]|nr:hypothetical protein [Clostridia bacterium]